MKYKEIWMLLSGLFLVSLSFAQDFETKPPIKIGFVYGLTGSAQAWAGYGRMGAELAIKEINAAGGIGGRKIEAIWEDSKTNPTSSVNAYKKLVNVNKVDVVVGDVWDFITIPMIPLSKRDKKLLISPTFIQDAAEETLKGTGSSEHFFTLGQRISGIKNAIRKFFATNANIKTVALLCWEDDWGAAYLTVWREVIKERGLDILDEQCSINFANDYRSEISRIAPKAPDAIIFAHLSEVVIRRVREQKLLAHLLTSSNMVEVLDNKTLPYELAEGTYFTDWSPSQEFVQKFEKAYAKYPILDAANHYDTIQAIKMAVENSPKDIRAGLLKVRFQGAQGPIDFTKGFAANYSEGKLMRVEGGRIKLVD